MPDFTSRTPRRAAFGIGLVLLLPLCLPTGCITIPEASHVEIRQGKQPIPVSPDKATIVFIRYSNFGPFFATVVDDQNRYYGTYQARTHAFTQVDPGSYVFTSWSWATPAFLSFEVTRMHAPSRVEADLLGGRVYYMLLRAWSAVGNQGVEVESLTPRRAEWEKLDRFLAGSVQLEVGWDAGTAAFDPAKAERARGDARLAFDALDDYARGNHLLKRADGQREAAPVE